MSSVDIDTADVPADVPVAPLGHQFGQTALTNMSIGGINLFTGLALARLLGPSNRGLLAAVINWPLILATFGTIGLTEACAYYTSRRAGRAREFYLMAITLSTLVSSALAAIGWLLMPLLLTSQPATTVTASRWLLLLVPFATIVTVSEGCLRGMQRVPIWNLYRVAWPAAWMLVIVASLVTGFDSPYVLAAGLALTRAVAAVPVVVILLRRLPGERRYQSQTARSLVRYGLPGFFTLLPLTMNSRLDQLLLAGLVNAKTLGLYVVSVAWSTIAAMPAFALGGLVLPRLAAIPDEEVRLAKFEQASRLAVLLATVTGVVVFFATPLVLPLLFGGSFNKAIPVAMILVVAASISAWSTVMEDGARGLGSPVTALKAEGVGLVVSVVLLVVLLGPFSITGAAIASLVAYTVTDLVVLRYARKRTGASVSALLIPRRSDLGELSLSTIRAKFRAKRGVVERTPAAVADDEPDAIVDEPKALIEP